MKKLNNFVSFDTKAFLQGKVLMAMKSENLVDFESQMILGAKYTIIVWSDSTNYGDATASNAGETLIVKVKGAQPKEIKQPTKVTLVNPHGVVFGDYRNQLSITADDVVSTKEG
ncbi:MAG: hypothetical protein ABF913_02090 [Oenococcus sp.]|uniref:hypothetical protein n=1 Tax=Oenococcus sp. TaxID=1979414 RepID=UPI0039EA9201